jgi:hypothetical protein
MDRDTRRRTRDYLAWLMAGSVVTLWVVGAASVWLLLATVSLGLYCYWRRPGRAK